MKPHGHLTSLKSSGSHGPPCAISMTGFAVAFPHRMQMIYGHELPSHMFMWSLFVLCLTRCYVCFHSVACLITSTCSVSKLGWHCVIIFQGSQAQNPLKLPPIEHRHARTLSMLVNKLSMKSPSATCVPFPPFHGEPNSRLHRHSRNGS